MKRYIILFTSIALSAVILIFGLLIHSSSNGDNTEQPPSPAQTSAATPEPTLGETPESTPVPTPESPELIAIDNTPAEEYVDIEAGANNSANTLPWVGAWERTVCNCCFSHLVAISFKEIDLTDDSAPGFTWDEILYPDPSNNEVGNPPEELLNIPRRRIQNKDAARVVANEILEILGHQNRILRSVLYDANKNIWIFSYGPESLDPGTGFAYVVNGYNSQIIRWLLS